MLRDHGGLEVVSRRESWARHLERGWRQCSLVCERQGDGEAEVMARNMQGMPAGPAGHMTTDRRAEEQDRCGMLVPTQPQDREDRKRAEAVEDEDNWGRWTA